MRRLVTIPISHYCEKARWALERAGLDYEEERHVQGIHQVVAKRAGGGITVPVLVCDEGVFAESEDILRYADRFLGEDDRLFPAGDEDVVAVSRWLDAGLGPDGRRLLYAHVLPMREQTLEINNQGVPGWEAKALAITWPVTTRYVKRFLGIGPQTKREDEVRVRATFDAVAERLADGRPHLCGERFTAADLTFAALAAPAVVPPEYTISLGDPSVLPPETVAMVTGFREHPAGAYALELFRTERRAVVAN